MSETSDAGGNGGFSVIQPDPLTEAAAAHAYHAVFAAIAYGKNRMAAQVLRDLEPEHLAELHVICGDVQVMVEAEQRRRGADAVGPEGEK